jgi:hypothetical protein
MSTMRILPCLLVEYDAISGMRGFQGTKDAFRSLVKPRHKFRLVDEVSAGRKLGDARNRGRRRDLHWIELKPLSAPSFLFLLIASGVQIYFAS